MGLKDQVDQNAAANQQATCTPSDCKVCKRQGIPLFPLRVAAVPKSLVNTGWQPAVPTQDSALTGGEFKYALRILREGYLYVLLDKKVWQVYQITAEGFLRQLNACEMPECEKTESLCQACLTQNHDVMASFINIDPDYTQAMVAFSTDPWSDVVLDEYKSGKRPATRFIQVTLADGKVTIPGGNRSLTLDPSLTALKSNVLEFATKFYPSVIGKEGQPGGAHGFYPRMAEDKQIALGNQIAQLQQQYGSPVNAIVLDDAVGIVQELNHGRMDVVQALAAFTSENSNIHQKMISDAIVQIRTQTTQQLENDPQIKGFPTPGYSGSYTVSREAEIAIKVREALDRMEDYYDEPARATFATQWQTTVDLYTRQQTAIWQDLDGAYASVLWLAILNNDYAPETSVLSWSFQLRTIAACLQGSVVGCDTENLKPDGKKPQWADWLQNPLSPPFMALLRNKHDFSEEVFNGTLTYSNLKTVLNSKEVSAFVNSPAYQKLVASLVTAIAGAFSSLDQFLSKPAKSGVVRMLQAVAYVAEGGPTVTVFSGKITVREYQYLLLKQLDTHGKSPLSISVEEKGRTARISSARHWLQITDKDILNRKIEVRLTAPVNNPGKLSGITVLTPDVIDRSLTTGEIALGEADMRIAARFQATISTDFQSGLLGLVLAGILLRTTFSNIEALKTAMPGDVQAEVSLASGSLIVMSSVVELVGQSAAVLNLFKKGDFLIRAAGVIGGLAAIVDGIALGMKTWGLVEAGDTTAVIYYGFATVSTLVAGGVGVYFSAVGNFALLGPVGWCIALGVLAVALVSIGNYYVRSPLERWLTHTCFGNRDECDDDNEPVWHKESLPDMQKAMQALHIVASGVTAQLNGDWVKELTDNTRLLGNRMLATRVTLPDCNPGGSDWLVELVATGSGGLQVLARSGSAAKLAGLTALQPQVFEKIPLQLPRADTLPVTTPAITKETSSTSLSETWLATAENKPYGLQLDGEFPLNMSRFTGAELIVSYWPDKTRQDDSLQLSTQLDC